MTEAIQNPKYAASAARVFLESCPEYVVSETNWTILLQELLKLEADGMSPYSVQTYHEAFRIAKSKNLLTLNAIPPTNYSIKTYNEYQSPEFFAALSPEDKDRFGERLATLPQREIDSLPAHLARFFVVYEHRQSNKKPELSENDKTFAKIVLTKGFAANDKNYSVLAGWLRKRELDGLESNWKLALDACADHLDLTEKAIDMLSADEYRKRVVDPELKRKRTAESKLPKKERGNPAGTNFTSWLHSQ